MAVSEDDLEIMRSCMQMAVKEAPLVSEYFHDELFRLAPETRQLYRMNLVIQGRLLIDRMSMIVTQMHDIEALRPFVEDLAIRHVGYGVRPEHYPLVRQALVAAFRRLLGTQFTSEAETAWTEAYDSVASIMVDVAYGNAADPPKA